LLKGRTTHEGHLVTQTIFVDSASQTPRTGDLAGHTPGAAGERALDCLLAAGFERTEPPILHAAAIFLDMSGEEVRRRLFLTTDAAGEELCLRPEYTIPVCRAYLGSDKAGKIAEYSYLGPVFRARAGQVGEQTQTGLESFGRRDAEAADAEVFSLAVAKATASWRRPWVEP
jgi:ATP phosphoribosyltransferase regulatory subunit